jgi:type I restriction enzyme M protein
VLTPKTFWVPKVARWSKLKAEAKQPTIGKTIDDAMLAIERDNPSLKGVLPKEYAHPRAAERTWFSRVHSRRCWRTP